ncbi:MAG: hypothetical protein A2583_07360 [Bdellovibrionales bacterium RIFOXYD1_FULL_53_11]|nr:MAG: hypothetical protein A2583_07360 [Bdellovibrionales bacterium RIFOXYD1_FULL_53_11]
MRWNCPHCGSALAVTDDKLGTGWTFSRCYKCSGYALVRRTDINLIKVDKAPAGERVLLPEASEELQLSRDATNNMSRISGVSNPGGKPSIIPAQRNAAMQAQYSQRVETRGVAVAPNNLAAAAAIRPPAFTGVSALPDPLPDMPGASIQRRMLPFAIGVASVMAVGSGIYLYMQGQQLWSKTRHAATQNVNHMKPVSVQVPTILNQQQATRAGDNEITDQVKNAAMAPSRNIQTEQAQSAQPIALAVKARSASTVFRTGPGLNFPVIGKADPEARYIVKEWKERWFQVELPAARVADGTQMPATAWVRNDVVEPLSVKTAE